MAVLDSSHTTMPICSAGHQDYDTAAVASQATAGAIQFVSVKVTESSGDHVAVTGDLESGDRVAVRGAESLEDGELVAVQSET